MQLILGVIYLHTTSKSNNIDYSDAYSCGCVYSIYVRIQLLCAGIIHSMCAHLLCVCVCVIKHL